MDRRAGEGGGRASILTTDANALTAPVHAQAMPVRLTSETMDIWLDGAPEQALALARPFPAEQMQIVLSGPREDPGDG